MANTERKRILKDIYGNLGVSDCYREDGDIIPVLNIWNSD